MIPRRHVLRSLAGGCLVAVAGCTGSSDADISDSDDDGVIDSHDYAPNDPEVQEKADVGAAVSSSTPTMTATSSSTETPSPTPTATPSPTPTTTPSPTPTETATPAPSISDLLGNQLSTYGFDDITGISYITSYGKASVSVRVDSRDPNISDLGAKQLEVYVMGYPAGDVYARGESDSLGARSSVTKTLTLDWERTPTARDELFVLAFLVPENETVESAAVNEVDFLHETDPFRLKDRTTAVRVDLAAFDGLRTEEGTHYSRTVREGEFALTFSGQTAGHEWGVELRIYKHAYLEALQRSHSRRRSEFVAYEAASGFAGELATMLHEIAMEQGFTEKREQVDFVIDFVQHLPYVPDDVSKGYDDYTKFSIETLAELGGDCEDSSIMLCGILQAAPFDYDMVLIQPTGHMAAGIYGDDLPGYYWEADGRKYFYIETTGPGWAIGDVPDEYDEAYVIQV